MAKYKEVQTKALMYGKYPYRINLTIKNYECLLSPGIRYLRSFNDQSPHDYYHQRLTSAEVKKILAFHSKLEKFKTKNKNCKLRESWSGVSLFIETETQFEEMKKKFHTYVIETMSPKTKQDLVSLGEKRGIILCDKFPHNRFKFRISLSKKCDELQRSQFQTWIKQYTHKSSMPGNTKGWLENDWYVSDPYIYIEDEATLTMCGLFLGKNIKKKYEYVLRKPINTVSKDKNAKSKQNI